MVMYSTVRYAYSTDLNASTSFQLVDIPRFVPDRIYVNSVNAHIKAGSTEGVMVVYSNLSDKQQIAAFAVDAAADEVINLVPRTGLTPKTGELPEPITFSIYKLGGSAPTFAAGSSIAIQVVFVKYN